jgi:cysteine desulfurase
MDHACRAGEADDRVKGDDVTMTVAQADMPIYLDYQATTPTDERVVAAMLPWFTERFGNPHSRDHRHGWDSEEAVETAREQVAALIGATPKEIVFTSGATESNNLAIKGVAEAAGEDRRHIVTCVTEHKCVLESCNRMEERGFDVTRLPVESNGLIDLDKVSAAVTDRTALVSIMTVNNEIGVIQPVAEIGRICRERGAKFHTDAAQAVGKVPVDVNSMNIDLMSISGHKLYGPKGIGVLYIRRRPRVPIVAQMDGGGQERGFRSGTVPTPLAVGLGEACAIAQAEMAAESARLYGLRDRFLTRLRDAVPDVHLHGDLERRIGGNLNVSFPDVDGQDLMMRLTGLSVSTGSACSSAAVGPSHVLSSLGVEPRLLHNALRIGLGRFTTEDEVDCAVEMIVAAVRSQRSASQMYEQA